jgi:hypothetical protein
MTIAAYGAIGLTGGTDGKLDAILAGSVNDQDIAFTIDVVNSKYYMHWMDEDAAGAESSPEKIQVESDASKRWIQVGPHLGDNIKAYFGTGNDVEMYFNGTNLIIDPTGGDVVFTGDVNINADGTYFRAGESQDIVIGHQGGTSFILLYNTSPLEIYDGSNTNTLAKFVPHATTSHVELYYGGIEALSTTAAGVDVFDTSGGDPALVLKSSGGTAKGTLSINSADDSVYLDVATAASNIYLRTNNGASNGLIVNDAGPVVLYYAGTQAFLTLADGAACYDTSGDDPVFYLKSDADATMGQVFTTGIGANPSIGLKAGTQTVLYGTNLAGTILYYNGAEKFTTSNTGGTITGTLVADDLSMEAGGNLTVGAGGTILDVAGNMEIWAFSTDKFMTFVDGGAATLYHNGSDVMVTNSQGIELPNGALVIQERSSDPTQPAEGHSVIWMSNGAGKGDDGDIMIASTAGGVTKYTTLFDHSAGSAW